MIKILSIAWKDLYITFTDRNLILIRIVTPLALATIIGSAFSGFFGSSSTDVPIRDISLAVVNLDHGAGETNSGQIFIDVLVPPADVTPEQLADNPLYQLTDATAVADAASARAGVDAGTYRGAIIIPPDFSTKISYGQNDPIQPVTLEVYASGAFPTSASVIRSLAEGIANQIAAGNITVQATIEAMIAQAQNDPAFGLRFLAASTGGTFSPDFSPAFEGMSNPIGIEQQTITGEANSFNPLVLFGSAQAVFFMMFTAIGGATSLLEERRDGTFQRQIASPTPRVFLLLGKFLGVFLTCLVQVTLLILAMTLVGSILEGQATFIWGNNVALLALVLITVAMATSGIGTIVAAVIRTPEQGNVISGVLGLLFGVLGGAFFSIDGVPVLNRIRVITPHYWGVDAFSKLALGNWDIGLNLLVLALIGIVFFVTGVTIFSRRLNV